MARGAWWQRRPVPARSHGDAPPTFLEQHPRLIGYPFTGVLLGAIALIYRLDLTALTPVMAAVLLVAFIFLVDVYYYRLPGVWALGVCMGLVFAAAVMMTGVSLWETGVLTTTLAALAGLLVPAVVGCFWDRPLLLLLLAALGFAGLAVTVLVAERSVAHDLNLFISLIAWLLVLSAVLVGVGWLMVLFSVLWIAASAAAVQFAIADGMSGAWAAFGLRLAVLLVGGAVAVVAGAWQQGGQAEEQGEPQSEEEAAQRWNRIAEWVRIS